MDENRGDQTTRIGDYNESEFANLLRAECDGLKRRISRRIPWSMRSLIDADDVLQHACVDAFHAFGTVRFENRAALSGWFATIARRALIDTIRALRAEKRGGRWRPVRYLDPNQSLSDLFLRLHQTSITPSRQAVARECLERLEKAVVELPDHYRLVVELYDLQQQTIEEVACRLGRSIGAAFMLRNRAHRMLASMLESSAE